MSFKSLFVKYHLLNWTTTKMKNRNHPWSLQNQKSTFTVKFSPCFSSEVTFFVLIRFPGRATAYFSSASWPCLSNSDLPQKFRACCDFQWSQIPRYAVVGQEIHQRLRFGAAIFSVPRATSQIRKRSTSPYSLLWERGLLATVTLNDAHQQPLIAYKTYLSRYFGTTKQNNYVRMTFPENMSLQWLTFENQHLSTFS